MSEPTVTTSPLSWPEAFDAPALGDGYRASAIERPGSLDDLGASVRRRVEEGLAIYPQGGRTALDFGGPPERPGAVIDLTGLDRIVEYPAEDMTITVEAGLTLTRLQQILAEQGQRLPLDAPDPDRATLGGIVATNASGPRRLAFGGVRDLILGVRYVDPAGQAIRGGGKVVKNVAGYDLPRLMTGSLGTLGVLAELTLKVAPIPERSALVWIAFRDLEGLQEAGARLARTRTTPVSLDVLNSAMASGFGGADRVNADAWNLVLGFEGNGDVVGWQVDRIGIELGRTDLIVFEQERTHPIWDALAQVQTLPEDQAPDSGRVQLLANLRRGSTLDWLGVVDSGRWAVQAQIGNGLVHLHQREPEDLETTVEAVDRLRAEAVARDGNLIVPRCPTAWKASLKVWGEPRADWALARSVKQALDPDRVFNPGRFVDAI